MGEVTVRSEEGPRAICDILVSCGLCFDRCVVCFKMCSLAGACCTMCCLSAVPCVICSISGFSGRRCFLNVFSVSVLSFRMYCVTCCRVCCWSRSVM